jgi:hypothetical protein
VSCANILWIILQHSFEKLQHLGLRTASAFIGFCQNSAIFSGIFKKDPIQPGFERSSMRMNSRSGSSADA